jgi:hypothetical protein
MTGFITTDGYAAVPYQNQLMLIFNNEQLEVVKTIKQAEQFIKNHKAGPHTVTPKPKRTRKPATVESVNKKTNGNKKNRKDEPSKSISRRSKKSV